MVNAFNKDREDATEFGYVDCKRSFASQFTNSCVNFSRRETNKIVHPLAKIATFLASSNTFIDAPTCITHLLINELL